VYRHTQHASPFLMGYLGIVTLVMLGALVLLLASPATRGEAIALGLGVAVLVGCMVVFRSMTIEVAGGRLTWWYGPGWPRRSVPLSTIAAARPARTRWWDGWGIHWTRRGWLWNVRGYDAVELERRGARSFRLGTDEPQALAEAVGSVGVVAAR